MVSDPLRRQVMGLAHHSILGGHLGSRRTIERVFSNFYWPSLRREVTQFCKSCDICQRKDKREVCGKVPLQNTPIIDVPFKRVAVDPVEPMSPPSESGYRDILTLVDYATRYPEAVPLKNIDMVSVAEALLDIYSRVGVPEEVLSDLGRQFVSYCIKEVSRLLSISQLITTPYHPMNNGLVERFNGTLKTMLRRLCAEKPKQGDRYVNSLLFAYRDVPQESTWFSPFEIVFGRTVRGPMRILRHLWTQEDDDRDVRTTNQYVLELKERLEHTKQIARKELRKAQRYQKRHYDFRARQRQFEKGDMVLVLLPKETNKLLMQWKGP